MESGSSDSLGAVWDGSGVNFAVFAPQAEGVELCLYDTDDNETARHAFAEQADGVWHGRLSGCAPGQRYGYRVHGPYDPAAGLRFNPNKLLLDPYAREIAGRLTWSPAVLGYHAGHPRDLSRPSEDDSAPFVPKAVVTGKLETPGARPDIPWPETILYETHVRGYTMRHPAVPDADRGTFRGLSNGEVLAYLKSLGVTSVELMPAQAFLNERFLEQRGLSNYWGYNTLAFFAPEPRYLGGGGIHEFVEMTNAIHDAGLEVILDVVYNHTAEGDQLGPTLCFRGLDNGAYYRLAAHDAGEYVNDTGCGNTINTDHPIVRRLIRDSLAYWHEELGVDGFRFDLAPVLGRNAEGFTRSHDFFTELENDSRLVHAKLIAEPWDVGPGGYQLGGFPEMFAEWNDRYRDTVRQFWRGDDNKLPELGAMVAGSAELFERSGRGPWASINFVASHDGFTTTDLVSYAHRHNAANGEQNRDGHAHNYSANYGVEGPAIDPEIIAIRRRQRLNLLTTLLMSQGTPMLLAGDEFGNSQAGNNNAYAQDNETGWLDWSGLTEDPEFVAQVRALIALRRKLPLLRRSTHLHGRALTRGGRRDIDWLDSHGERLADGKWRESRTLTVLYSDTRGSARTNGAIQAVALVLNVDDESVEIELPRISAGGGWYSPLNGGMPRPIADGKLKIGAVSSTCVLFAEGAPPSLEEPQ